MEKVIITPNVPLLYQTLEYIETHPDEHDQRQYRCGTKHCFAGIALVLLGLDGWIDEVPGNDLHDELHPLPGEEYELWFTGDDDEGIPYVSPRERAKRILGLDDLQADDLFHEDNSIPQLREIVDEIVQEAS